MNVSVYGLVGHSGHLELSLEDLDVESLEPGAEFEYQGSLYEIRSVQEGQQGIRINVVITLVMGRN